MNEEEVKIEGKIDIDQALKEFEEKSSAEQIEETSVAEKIPNVPKMVQLVMKWSGIKEQRQAEYILLGFIVIAVGISLYLFFNNTGSKAKLEAPPGYEVIYPKDNRPPYLQPKL